MARAFIELDHFTAEDIEGLDDELVIKLQCIRYMVDLPIYITSGLRGGQSGAHPDGYAVDISDNPYGEPISSHWRWLILGAAYAIGFSRIGDYDRHVHLDISPDLPQEVTWWGRSS